MADTAYDADHLREAIAAKGAIAVIPNNPSRALKYPLDKHLYAQRHLVECCFSKLKQFRRVATRFRNALFRRASALANMRRSKISFFREVFAVASSMVKPALARAASTSFRASLSPAAHFSPSSCA